MAKFFIRFFWIIVIFSFIRFQPLPVAKGPAPASEYRDFSDTLATVENLKPVVILGDLQRTSLLELMVGREQNDYEREKLIQKIAKEDPSLIILLGDMVSDGSDNDNWKYFDSLLIPVNNIPVLPVMGNHDYTGDRKSPGFNNIKNRFRHLEKSTWYSRVYGNIALIFLDTNENLLSSSEWNEQENWFKKILSDYDNDPEIHGILVFMHHPPFTNSIVTGDEENIQETFISHFINSKKGLAVFSGHAHTYENFKIKGKHFLVSGGGGGPRVILKKGKNVHKDECDYKGVRPFHYILLQENKNSVDLTVKGLNKNGREFFILDSLTLKI